jgi:hypothetical protein
VTRLELIPIRHPTLWVGDAQYRGTVRFERQSGGTMLVVNAVDLEDYLSSVLNSELPADFPAAARQTQAIAARTYALYQMKTASASGAYDLRNDSQSQVYRGVQYREGGRALAVETDDSQPRIIRPCAADAPPRGAISSRMRRRRFPACPAIGAGQASIIDGSTKLPGRHSNSGFVPGSAARGAGRGRPESAPCSASR